MVYVCSGCCTLLVSELNYTKAQHGRVRKVLRSDENRRLHGLRYHTTKWMLIGRQTEAHQQHLKMSEQAKLAFIEPISLQAKIRKTNATLKINSVLHEQWRSISYVHQLSPQNPHAGIEKPQPTKEYAVSAQAEYVLARSENPANNTELCCKSRKCWTWFSICTQLCKQLAKETASSSPRQQELITFQKKDQSVIADPNEMRLLRLINWQWLTPLPTWKAQASTSCVLLPLLRGLEVGCKVRVLLIVYNVTSVCHKMVFLETLAEVSPQVEGDWALGLFWHPVVLLHHRLDSLSCLLQVIMRHLHWVAMHQAMLSVCAVVSLKNVHIPEIHAHCAVMERWMISTAEC